MRDELRALAVRGRWSYRRFRWKLRRGRRPLGQTLPFPVGTSLALFPFVILMAASAALLHARGARHDADFFQGPLHTAADRALAPYRELRDEVVGAYAVRYRVPHRLAGVIYEAAVSERLDPDLAFGLVRTESSFHPRAVGPAGAVGLSQIRPSTARWLDSTVTRERLFEVETNLRLGFRYLRMLLRTYDHDTRLALLAYNRGPATVAALLSLGQDPSNGYAERVMGAHGRVRQIVAVREPELALDGEAAGEPAPEPAAAEPAADSDSRAAGAETTGEPAPEPAATEPAAADRPAGAAKRTAGAAGPSPTAPPAPQTNKPAAGTPPLD